MLALSANTLGKRTVRTTLILLLAVLVPLLACSGSDEQPDEQPDDRQEDGGGEVRVRFNEIKLQFRDSIEAFTSTEDVWGVGDVSCDRLVGCRKGPIVIRQIFHEVDAYEPIGVLAVVLLSQTNVTDS